MNGAAPAASAPTIGLAAAPRATARVQLNRHYTFDDARACLDYFARLGISHLFVSPILTARAGSMHGYDVVDHAQVNPELGGEDGLRRLSAALRAHGMGLVVDTVPNHVAVGKADNARWLDVLEWGRDSRNAVFFDIDWDRSDPALAQRVHAPFLGEPYGEALAQGLLRLQFDPALGRFHAAYADHVFPLAPDEYAPLLAGGGAGLLAERFGAALRERGRAARIAAFEQARRTLAQAAREDAGVRACVAAALARFEPLQAQAQESLHRLLERQHYRLAWWRTAADEINWRRFFDVTELAAIRVQDRGVFEAVHECTLRLYAEGLIDGLRIDHVDGLADPRAYCRALRSRLQRLAPQRPADAARGRSYIVVEKILAPGERLPDDWQVDGTSGYSFMNDVGALLHDPAGHEALTRFWTEKHGRDFEDEERRARRHIPETLFAADFAACAHALHQVARSERRTRDWTLGAIRRVLSEILVHFPVYRTYADARGRSDEDARIMQRVVEAAAATCRPGERPLLHCVDAWLGGEPAKDVARPAERRLRLRALARFQQLTSPVAAKSVEDTAFYRHARLLSRNEVGADPRQFALPAPEFHRICADRRVRYPRALLATATHDHKRGEDARMRLSMLSECAQDWVGIAGRWRRLNEPLRRHGGLTAPDEIDEYMLYQTLVGSWPLELDLRDAAGMSAYLERLRDWQRKALREAKRHSTWTEPQLDYERGCEVFLEALLDSRRSPGFLESLSGFVEAIAAPAAVKSLSQVLLRIASPGVPDLYQGTEFWDFSLVDPDNRRPVDYARRVAALDAPAHDDWRSGAIKQRLIARALALRAQAPELFMHGDYRPLPLQGVAASRFLAFSRHQGRRHLVVVAPIRSSGLLASGRALRPAPSVLGDTVVEVPALPAGLRWRDVLEDRELACAGPVRLDALLERWPLALLHANGA